MLKRFDSVARGIPEQNVRRPFLNNASIAGHQCAHRHQGANSKVGSSTHHSNQLRYAGAFQKQAALTIQQMAYPAQNVVGMLPPKTASYRRRGAYCDYSSASG